MKKIIAMFMMMGIILSADVVKIGTGSSTGNYYGMMKDLTSSTYCGNISDFQVISSDGSLDNLQGMDSKKFTMGVVQSDALMSQAKTSPSTVNLNLIKIVAGLHTETVHLLVPVGYKPAGASESEGSLWSRLTADKKPTPIKLSSLKGQVISSWGGSLVSAKALSYFFGLNWKLNTITEAQAVNTMTPILLVGGQPYAPVEKLLATGKWTLLPIDYNTIAAVAPFYQKVSATYKVQGKVTSIPTVGIQALLMAKSFRNADKNVATVKLSQCIQKNLADLADDSNTNPNWNSAYELNKKGTLMQWSYFGK